MPLETMTQEQRTNIAIEKYTKIKADVDAILLEARKLNEDTVKHQKLDDKIAALKAEQKKTEDSQASYTEYVGRENASLDKKRTEASEALKNAQDEGIRIAADRDKLSAERKAFEEEKATFAQTITEKEAQIKKTKEDAATMQATAEASALKTTELIKNLELQEAKTREAADRLKAETTESENKTIESRNQTEKAIADLEQAKTTLENERILNQKILDDIRAETTKNEDLKVANQKILDDTRAEKEVVLAKEKRVSDLLNRQADIQGKLDEHEKILKETSAKLGIPWPKKLSQ